MDKARVFDRKKYRLKQKTAYMSVFARVVHCGKPLELKMDNKIISRLITFGEANESIRAIILEGSHAAGRFIDDLSDFDVNIFTDDAEPFLQNAGWFSQFGEVLIYQKEELIFYGQAFPSRLVVFRDGSRIDFTFWPVSVLMEMANGSKRYESYRNGFRVLVDKDGLTANLPEPDGLGFQVAPPESDQFLQTIYDFWFEAYCVARSLARGDLWYAKRSKPATSRTICTRWRCGSINPGMAGRLTHCFTWAANALSAGRNRNYCKRSPDCFSAYSIDATWKSLFAMVELFNRFARGLAELGLNFLIKNLEIWSI